uniref:Uncharacterized protein n=1 Tax=Cannabis sativa TaxID=3483 RepID=A0A803PUK3_CANSA
MSKRLHDWRADAKKAWKENIKKYGEEEVTRRSCLNVVTSEVWAKARVKQNVKNRVQVKIQDMLVMTQVMGERSRHLRGLSQLPRRRVGAKKATPRAAIWPPGAGSSSHDAPPTQDDNDNDDDNTIVDL